MGAESTDPSIAIDPRENLSVMTSELAVEARKAEILIVDDDEIAVEIIRRGIARSSLNTSVRVAYDGEEALRMLRETAAAGGNPSRTLVLLDLNMPRMNGFEFLSELRTDPDLHKTLVFVLTTSDAHSDRDAVYQHNVVGYLLKQDAGENFSGHLRLIEDYIQQVQFP